MKVFVHILIAVFIGSTLSNCKSKELAQLSFALAAARGDAQQVGKLLKTDDIDINAQNGEIGPALGIASYGGFKDVVIVLLDNNADINVKDGKGTTPLMNAVIGEKPDIVRLLLERGADVSLSIGRSDPKGEPITAKTFARIKGNREIIDLLKADIQHK